MKSLFSVTSKSLMSKETLELWSEALAPQWPWWPRPAWTTRFTRHSPQKSKLYCHAHNRSHSSGMIWNMCRKLSCQLVWLESIHLCLPSSMPIPSFVPKRPSHLKTGGWPVPWWTWNRCCLQPQLSQVRREHPRRLVENRFDPFPWQPCLQFSSMAIAESSVWPVRWPTSPAITACPRWLVL